MPQLYTSRVVLFLCLFLITNLLLGQNCIQVGTNTNLSTLLANNLSNCGSGSTINVTNGGTTGIANGNNVTTVTATAGGTLTVQIVNNNNNPCGQPITIPVINSSFTSAAASSCFTVNLTAAGGNPAGCTYSYFIDGQWVAASASGSLSYTFNSGGTFPVRLRVTCGSCVFQSAVSNITVNGVIPTLSFQGDTYLETVPVTNLEPLPTPTQESNNTNVLAYCVYFDPGVTNNQFPLTFTDGSPAATGITNYTVVYDGNQVYNSNTAPSNIAVSPVPTTDGYHTLSYSITANGCTSTEIYQIYIAENTPLNMSLTPSSGFICINSNVNFSVPSDFINYPAGTEITMVVACNATLSAPLDTLYTQTWSDPSLVPSVISWSPNRGSCGCTNNNFYVFAYASNPCYPSTAPGINPFTVQDSKADFPFLPSYCQGSYTFTWPTAGNCGGTHAWQLTSPSGVVTNLGNPGATSVTANFNAPGTWTLTHTVNTANCGSDTFTATICVSDNVAGNVNWGSYTTGASVCLSGASVTLNPVYTLTSLPPCPGQVITYNWSVTTTACSACDNASPCFTITGNGTPNPTIVLTCACNYTITCSVTGCGTDTETLSLSLVAPPIITSSTICTTNCLGQTWSPSSCITVNSCNGIAPLASTFTYNSVVYNWSDFITFPSSGNYPIVLTSSSTVTVGLCSSTQSITVVATPPPTPSIAGPTQVCVGSPFSLSANACAGVGQWTQGSTPISAPTNVTMPGSALNYTYSCTVGGCVGSASYTVTPYPTFAVAINGPSTACSNLPPQLTANVTGTATPASYVWTENTNVVAGATTASYNDPSFTATTTYGVTVTSTNGCSASATLPVTIQNAPILNCGNLSFCETDVNQGITFSSILSWASGSVSTATWTVSNGTTTYNVPAGSSSVTVGQLLTFFGNLTATTTFTLTYSITSAATNCVYTANCTFTIIAEATTQQSATACVGQTLTLTPLGTGTWSWITPPPVTTSGASGNIFNFTPQAGDAGGPYVLLFNSGCQDTEYSITVGNIAVVIDDITNPTICSGGAVSVTALPTPATNIQSIAWTTSPNLGTGSNAQFNLTNVTQNVTLSVLITNTLGCTGNATYAVTIDAPPVLQTTTLSPYYCETSTASIALNGLLTQNGSPANGVNWTFCDQPIVGTSFNIQDVPNYCGPVNADVNDSLEYTFTSAAGCVYSGFYLIQIDDQSITNDTRTICANAQLTITGIPAATWNTTALPAGGSLSTTGGNFVWTPMPANAGGPYSITYNSGCSQTIYAITVQHFDIDVITSDPLICPNASANLSVNITNSNVSGYTYEWHQGSLAGALLGAGATQSVSPTVATNYYVIVSTTNCSRNDNVSVSVEGVPTFNNGLAPQYCETIDQTINLAPLVTFPAAQIQSSQWSLCSNTIGGNSITVFNAVNWCGPINADDCFDLAYTMTTTNQCTHTHTFSLCIQNETETTTPHHLCEGSTLSLTGIGNWINVSLPPGSPSSANNQNGFVWNTTTAQGGGPYILEYNNGCSATYHQITVHETPIIDVTVPDPALCLQQTTAVNSIPFTAQSWSYTYVNPAGTLALASNAPYTVFDPSSLGITNTAAGQICLHAENVYAVTTPALVCAVDDCANVDIHNVPAFPIVPAVLCYQEPFQLTPCSGTFDDFELDFNGTVYSNCPVTVSNLTDQQNYTLTLIYGGTDLCEVSTTGSLDIAQPLIADMTVSSDPCTGEANLFLEITSGENYTFDLNADAALQSGSTMVDGSNPVLFNTAPLASDFLFPITVTIANSCESIDLTDDYQFIHPPVIVIDYIQQTIICSGEEVQFTINENAANATDYIDEVFWDYGNGTTETLANTSYPDPIIYEALGVTQTYNISATASNQCGSYTSTTEVTVYPVDVSIVLPPLEDVCPGSVIDLSGVQITGTYVDETITFAPNSNIAAIAYPTLWQVPVNAAPGPVVLTYEIEGCSITSDQSFFNILESPSVNMTVQANDGICTGEPVFFNITQQNAVSFEWYIDGQLASSNLIFNYTWDEIGTHDVTVVATSNNGCSATDSDQVEVNGPDIGILGDEFNFCGNKDVELSVGDQPLLEIVWTVTADGVDTVVYGGTTSITHFFQNTGLDLITYNVHLFARDFDNCVSEADYSVYAKPSPIADFTFLPPDNCFDGTEVDFFNTSEGATNYLWTFDDGFVSNDEDVSHGFNGTGEYFIQLQAFNSYNCSDYTEQSIICGETNLYVPNVFTPNGDGTNDTFKPIVYELDKYEIEPENYLFVIKDRWGTTLFQTNNYQEVWTGNVLNGDYYAQNDAYVWLLTLVEPKLGLIIIEKEGLVTLVRQFLSSHPNL